MVKQSRNSTLLISGGFVLVALLIWLILMREFRLDDSFITYRYARNLARGWGLVYNRGEMVLSTTAPLYALLLTVLSPVISDFHTLGGLVGAVCIGAGAALLVDLSPRTAPVSVRAWGGLLYALSTPLWLALGMETPLWILLVLVAARLALAGRWPQAGLATSLAILTRPDAVIPGALLGLAAAGATVSRIGTTGRWRQPLVHFVASALIPVLAFALWAWATYGSPFPATLAAKNTQAVTGITGFGVYVDTLTGLRMIVESLVAQSALYLAFAPFVLLGVSRKLTWPVVLIVVWGILHLLGYTMLGVAPYRWYYVPLLPGTILLAVCGAQRLLRILERNRVARYAVAAGLLLPITAQLASLGLIAGYFRQGGPREVMLPIVDWQDYREAGEWLNANAPADAVVGLSEVGQVGFYADRYMTDYLGLLQPDVAALLRRGDLYSWLVGYAPDYLVFQRFQGQVGLALYNFFIEYDPWFVANYREVAKFDDPRYVLGPVVIYQRMMPVDRNAESNPADADFGPARLTGYVTDLQGESGGPMRLRLDWQVTGVLPPDLHIGIAVLDLPAEAKFDGDYPTQNWPQTLSTWHTLILPETVAPGAYPLWVSIGPIDGDFVPRTVGQLAIGSANSSPALSAMR